MGGKSHKNFPKAGKLIWSIIWWFPLLWLFYFSFFQTTSNHSDFSLNEFNKKEDVAVLCKVVSGDIGPIKITAQPETIDWLNELIRTPTLYDCIVNKRTISSLDCETQDNIRLLKKAYGDTNDKIRLKELNRSLLQAFYENEAPKNKDIMKDYLINKSKLKTALYYGAKIGVYFLNVLAAGFFHEFLKIKTVYKTIFTQRNKNDQISSLSKSILISHLSVTWFSLIATMYFSAMIVVLSNIMAYKAVAVICFFSCFYFCVKLLMSLEKFFEAHIKIYRIFFKSDENKLRIPYVYPPTVKCPLTYIRIGLTCVGYLFVIFS